MPVVTAVVIVALAAVLEHCTQWRYGAMGLVALVALIAGRRAKGLAIGGIGAVILTMLLTQPG